MEVIYINSNSFSVIGDRTSEFIENRRLKLVCGGDGTKYAEVVSSVFTTITTVLISETTLTSNLTEVFYSSVLPGTEGNLPNHNHSSIKGTGGIIPAVTFVELADTPSSYVGTGSQYLQSTGAGTTWETPTLVDLGDTPSNYSDGKFLKSTASGTTWETAAVMSLESGLEAPTLSTEGLIGDYYIHEQVSINKKNRVVGTTVYTAKSIIFDIDNNYGNTAIGLRSVELKLRSVLIDITAADIAAVYGLTYGPYYAVDNSFITALSKIGGYGGNQWVGSYVIGAHSRIICVFTVPQTFNGLVINNSHGSGTQLEDGIKDVKIIISDDVISDLTYAAEISNSTVIYEGTFAKHIAEDVIDDQVLDLSLDPIDDTGWDTVLESKNNLTELLDTPSSYTDGQFLKSTTSGSVWSTTPGSNTTVLYGTGDPPSPSGYVDGTIYFKYIY